MKNNLSKLFLALALFSIGGAMAAGTNTITQLQTYLAKVSAGDTTPGYLFSKLIAGPNITLTKNNPGANETITISSTGGSGGSFATTSINNFATTSFQFATGTSGSDFTIATSTTAVTFNIPDASGSARGLVTTGTQTFGGIKTFLKGIFTNASSTNFSLAGLFYDSVNSSGSLGNVLLNTGTSTRWVATSTLGISGGSGTPAAPDTSIQFNDGGSFGGSANLVFNKITRILSIGAFTGSGQIDSPDQLSLASSNGQFPYVNLDSSLSKIGIGYDSPAAATDPGGEIRVVANAGGATSGDGGDVYLNGGGSTSGNGGDVNLIPGVKGGAGIDGVAQIGDPNSSLFAKFNTASLATSDKTFTFPNVTGTFVLGTGSAGNCAQWSATNVLTAAASPCGSGGISNAYASSSYVTVIADQTVAGAKTFTGTTTLATTTISLLTVSGKSTLANASTSVLTATDLFASGNFAVAGTSNFTGKITATTASTTILTSTGLFSSGNLAVASNATIGGTLDITGKTTMTTASSTIFTSTGLFSSGNLTVAGTSNFTGKITATTASTTILTSTGLFSSGNLAVASNATIGGTLDITGKTTMTTASSTIFTSTGLFSSGNLAVAGTSNFTGNMTLVNGSSSAFTATNLYSTNIFPAGLTSSFLAVDNTGKIIATTSPSGGVTGGTNGFLARFTSPTAVTAGIVMDNGTVAGIGATSTTVLFNIQGTSGSANTVFNVATTSGPMFSVASTGNVGIGTTTPFAKLHIFSTNTSGVDPAMIMGGNVSGDTDFWLGRPNNNDTVDNDFFGIGKWSGAALATTTSLFTIDYRGFTGIASSTPNFLFSVGNTFTVATSSSGNVLDVASSSGTIMFGVAQNNHIISGGESATVTSCGTAPAISGTDRKGKITTGTGAPTACTLTFARAYVTPPTCVMWDNSTSVDVAASSTAITTTSVLMTFASFTSGTIYYLCEE